MNIINLYKQLHWIFEISKLEAGMTMNHEVATKLEKRVTAHSL